MALIRRSQPSELAQKLLETLAAAQRAYPEQTTFQCNKFFATRPDPYVEHVGLPGGSLDVNLALLNELAREGHLHYLQSTVHLGWDQRSVGGDRVELRLRDTGAREFPFALTADGLVQGQTRRTGMVRDLVHWEPAGWSWVTSFSGYDKTMPNITTARVESASVTRGGVQLCVRDGAQTFKVLLTAPSERERQPIAKALNGAQGLGLDAAADQRVG